MRRSVRRLAELAALPEKEFLADPDNFAIAEHHFRRAIEAAMDLGRHLIARLALGSAEEYADVPRVLGESRILSPETTTAALQLARLRSRPVHLYWQVTPAELHRLLQTQVEPLEAFCTEVQAFMDADRRPGQAGSDDEGTGTE
ncbi:MAG: DUF86 domain-containing protein [Armatimonadetes bacterium]|nr:DUF86 domain-containing protein [Armatimonadota bacterium]